MSIVEKAVDKLRGKPKIRPDHERESSAVRAGAALISSPDPHILGSRPLSSREPESRSIENTLSIDIAALRSQGLFPTETMEAQLLEEYRRIKRPFLSMLSKTVSAGSNCIMITSAVAGEGKSFTSVNLALSLAQEHDVSVLLVDADVVRQTVTRALGLAHQPGLLDLLADPTLDPSTLVTPTDWGSLSVMPAGQSKGLMTELLSSARAKTVLTSLERRRTDRLQFVILDSPPLLVTSESSALAGAVGSVIMVVKAGETTHQHVMSAVELLDVEKPVSFILNQMLRSHSSGYYGSKYYGYYRRQ